MPREDDVDTAYRAASRDYADAASRYETAVMSGSRLDRLEAQQFLEAAGERYARTLAATVEAPPLPALEDALTEAWSQPDATSMILASIIEYQAARPAAAGVSMRAMAARNSVVNRPWASLTDLLTGATASTSTGTSLGRPAFA